VAGERRQLARVGRLVKSEEDQCQTGIIAILVEQWAEPAGEIDPHRNVATLVITETIKNNRIVVTI
jgi:hypothetical protein